MNLYPILTKDKFKPDGSTDWSSKGLILWQSLIINSLWQIENIKNHSFSPGERESITISVLINLAGSVESFTKSMLYDYMMSEPDIIKSNSNIRNFLQSSVENHSFDKLRTLFPTIIGKNFSEAISCSKDISILMDLRNRLIHGQTPTITYHKITNELLFSNSYKDICEYLYKNIDIPSVQISSGYHIEYLSFKVIEHFLKIQIEYMTSFKNLFSVSFIKDGIDKNLNVIIEKINQVKIPNK